MSDVFQQQQYGAETATAQNMQPYTLSDVQGAVNPSSNPNAGMAGLASLGLAGTVISALGTIAGGSAQKLMYQRQAGQLKENAAGAIAGAQRQALDIQEQGRLLQGAATARAAASGVNAGVGSPVTTVGNIAARSEYNSTMALYRGQNAATGMLNQASMDVYQGDLAKRASYLTAAGTIAGGIGSGFGMLGKYGFPT